MAFRAVRTVFILRSVKEVFCWKNQQKKRVSPMPPISLSEVRAQVRLRLAWHGHLRYFLVHFISQQILLAVSILESPPDPF